MTPVFQENHFVHDPATGERGDCLRAALASLLDLDLHDIPHFVEQQNGHEDGATAQLQQWLKARDRILLICDYLPAVREFERLKALGAGDCYHLILGKNEKGEGHACVGMSGKLVHDPWGGYDGLTMEEECPSESWKVGLLVSLNGG